MNIYSVDGCMVTRDPGEARRGIFELRMLERRRRLLNKNHRRGKSLNRHVLDGSSYRTGPMVQITIPTLRRGVVLPWKFVEAWVNRCGVSPRLLRLARNRWKTGFRVTYENLLEAMRINLDPGWFSVTIENDDGRWNRWDHATTEDGDVFHARGLWEQIPG